MCDAEASTARSSRMICRLFLQIGMQPHAKEFARKKELQKKTP